MKKLLSLLLILMLSVTLLVVNASASAFSGGSGSSSIAGATKPANITAVTNDKLATRNGPGTEYDGCGTYGSAGIKVTLCSLWYDRNGVPWIEFEVKAGGGLKRMYTGLKRFDQSSFKVSKLPERYSLNIEATVTSTTACRFGPGQTYMATDLTVYAGGSITIVSIEGDWAQVDGDNHRAWVPLSCLRY